jgi:tRNA(Ile2) C34 agmatinyltransferase TiaS
MFEIIKIPAKQGLKIECHRCRHDWIYTGQNHFCCSCPRCKTTITITTKRKKTRDLLKKLNAISSEDIISQLLRSKGNEA